MAEQLPPYRDRLRSQLDAPGTPIPPAKTAMRWPDDPEAAAYEDVKVYSAAEVDDLITAIPGGEGIPTTPQPAGVVLAGPATGPDAAPAFRALAASDMPAHGHAIGDVAGLQAALDSIETTPGPEGPAGDSAYEVAVADGFVGTEAEWLASLVGPEGPQGIQGPEGDPGIQGPPGEGVPAAGLAGQVLAKATGADYDTAWVDPAAPGGGGVSSVDGRTGTVTLSDRYAAIDASGYLLLNGVRRLHHAGINGTFVGDSAGNTSTTGVNNVAVGYLAMAGLTTGSGNVAVGVTALQSITGGTANVGVGVGALVGLTTGAANMGVGQDALHSCVDGTNNAAVGLNSLYFATSGSFNVGIGRSSLERVTTGTANVGIGYNAGRSATEGNAVTTGSENTYVGAQSGPGTSTQLDRAGGVGAGALAYASNTFWVGGTGATYGVDAYAARGWHLADQSSTGTVRTKGYRTSDFLDGTDATYKGRMRDFARDAAADRETARHWSDGTAGRFAMAAPASAPTDAHLANSQISFHLDEVGGNLVTRVRKSDGTYATVTRPFDP